MCELFAANAKHPQTLNVQLSAFFRHSLMHPHGWGLALRNEDHTALYKGPERAIDSPECRRVLSAPVRAQQLIAHVRYATKGSISYDNTHPFVGLDATGAVWTFAHNGSIFYPEAIKRFSNYAHGQSDSECVLLYLISTLDEAAARGAVSFAERFAVLSDALGNLTPGNKVNVVLDDGAYTYIYTDTADDTLFIKQQADAVLFCTRPLDQFDWQPVPKCRLLAYREGSLVAASESKGDLYHFNEKEFAAFVRSNAA